MHTSQAPVTSLGIRLLRNYRAAPRRARIPCQVIPKPCMPAVRQLFTKPERTKQRRTLTVDAEESCRTSNMAPFLIQEIEDERPTSTAIQLNDTESTLRQLFLDVARYIEESSDSQELIVLRFTGGWVRDKLLGVPSHDIDVAINNLTGLEFGQKMLEYLSVKGNPEKYGLDGVATTEKQDQSAARSDKSKTVRGLHKIAANPEKSKHLETVATSVLGVDIDLVNLRKETYDENSRNPQMEFGTPEEDALRRDATVNAMFYNLNTKELEDFTGHGLTDMRKKLLRTPLEPYETFLDDPLRVLRLIRFASRLGWTIERSALEAMRHPDIKVTLQRKISRERVGIEVEKALRGPDPHEALRLIFDLDLYAIIFCDPTVEPLTEHNPTLRNASHVIDNLEKILDEDNSSIRTLAVRDPNEQYLAWQLAALIPYRDAPLPEPPQLGRKAPPPIACRVAREGIKATSKTCELVTASVRHLGDIRSSVDALHQHSRKGADRAIVADVIGRDILGMKIRLWGANWRSQLIFALLADIADGPELIDVQKRKYTTFLEHLRDLDILDAYQLKPLLDGKALAKALNTAPGPWMKEALDVVMAWQLRHPGQTDTAGAIEEVKTQGELAFSLAEHFLKLTIRPLFLKTKPHNITEQGRIKTTSQSTSSPASFDDETIRPWKLAQNSHALSLLDWATQSLDEQSVEQLWPLLIPPILTLLDDWETKYKKVGGGLLAQIVTITPTSLLKRTGLGPVFEDALVPCLAYLPPLTNGEESLQLLPTIYQALFRLADTRFPAAVSRVSETSLQTLPIERIMSLDTILRKGVIYGLVHASQHPAVMTILFHQLNVLIDKLGIDFAKHLKFVLPLLNETLSNPLSTGRPELIRTTVTAVQAVIRFCWPRMVVYRGEILRGLTFCWLAFAAQDSTEARRIRQDLNDCIATLRDAIGNQVDLDAEFTVLTNADARLADLFRH